MADEVKADTDTDAEFAALHAALRECKKRELQPPSGESAEDYIANLAEGKRLMQRLRELAPKTTAGKEEDARLAAEGLPLNWLRRNRLAYWMWRGGG